MACDNWRVDGVDTGKRKTQVKNGVRYETIVWVYRWTAKCGASTGGYTAKADATVDAIAHCRSCTR